MFLALLASAFWYGVREHHAPESCSWSLDLAAIRARASSLPGPRVHEIRVERLTQFMFPEAAVVTGAPFGLTSMVVYAYQLRFPGHSVIIDSGMAERQARAMHVSDYDPSAWGRLVAAMKQASAIYVTHEHADHLAGLVDNLGTPEIARAARITDTQLNHPELFKPAVVADSIRSQLTRFTPGALEAVAPGVVLIAAPGHTPGSQLVYVQRDDGKEFLFLGDVAWHERNLQEMRGQPRVVNALTKIDRDAVACQLIALNHTLSLAPEVIPVPGHDEVKVGSLLAQGLLVSQFQ